jgi:aminoglycoside phosphotransferase (APT) family kinase protein
VDLQPIERGPGAFQQGVSADQIAVMCRRAFGPGARATAAVELGVGMYNSTYRVELAGLGAVILRVAPEPARQFRVEREFMRNEHASVPYLAPIAALMPRTLAIDFTHEVISRDYLFQTLLDGIPAHEGLAAYPRPAWASFFRQVGTIARTVNSVRGTRFGSLAGPAYRTWSEAVIAGLEDTAADLDDAGLGAADVREVAAIARQDRATLDEIGEPRLLHGDLWTGNLMIAAGAAEPTITGVLDSDRASWGDPESDWATHMAATRPGTERDAFWDSYGPLSATPAAARRRLYYLARNRGGGRVELHRLGRRGEVSATYDQLRNVLAQLRV